MTLPFQARDALAMTRNTITTMSLNLFPHLNLLLPLLLQLRRSLELQPLLLVRSVILMTTVTSTALRPIFIIPREYASKAQIVVQFSLEVRRTSDP